MDHFRTLQEKLRQAISWYGPARAFATAGSVVVVCVGAWWLLRAPAPPLENSLPLVGQSSTASSLAASSLIVPSSLVAVSEGVFITGPVKVHVVGAVRKAGVYTLQPGARVIDAVTAAGGVVPNADTAAINMALAVHDADQIYIPLRGERAPRTTVAATRRQPASSGSPSTTRALQTSTTAHSPEVAQAATGMVNINTATALQLEELPSVGPSTAKAIVSYRTKNGPFGKAEDLMKVPGIGEGKLAAMKPFVAL
jgi:competence protein ComEA